MFWNKEPPKENKKKEFKSIPKLLFTNPYKDPEGYLKA